MNYITSKLQSLDTLNMDSKIIFRKNAKAKFHRDVKNQKLKDNSEKFLFHGNV